MKSLHLPLIIAGFLMTSFACPAEDNTKEPTQLSLLRKSWQQSRKSVVLTTDGTYALELQKLLDKYTKAGKLDEAVATKAELSKLGKDEPVPAGAANVETGKEPAQLAGLKRFWLQSRENALKPVDAKYVDELKNLLVTFTKAGRLEDALAIKNELAKAEGSALHTGVAVAPPLGAKSGMSASFVGKRWGTASGSHFVFQADGTGTQENASGRKWPLKWTKGQDDLLTVDAWSDDQKATLYFRFTKSNEGMFGLTSENLGKRVFVK